MSQRTSRVVCLLTLALLVVAAVLTAVSGATLLAALVLWPYVTAVVFLVLAAMCALLRRPAPSLPFGGRRLRGLVLVLVFAFVVVATITRENGNWGATISREYASWNTHINTNASSTVDRNQAPRMAGRPVVCTSRCEGGDRVCEALVGMGDCRQPGDSGEPVTVKIDAQVDAPRCFLPLYKTGRFSARASVGISYVFAGARSTAHLDITIDGEATKLGFASCRNYLGDIGETAAKAIVGQVNDYLARH